MLFYIYCSFLCESSAMILELLFVFVLIFVYFIVFYYNFFFG